MVTSDFGIAFVTVCDLKSCVQNSLSVTKKTLILGNKIRVFVPHWCAPHQEYNLNKNLVKVLHRWLCSSIGTIVTGFTKAKITSTSGECTQFYGHPCFQGHKWYDWALVHFQEMNSWREHIENHYPSKIRGFISIEGKPETVIQCSIKPLLWSTVDRFIVRWNWEPISTFCHKPPRYVPFKCTYVPYNGTFGASNQGQMLDVWQGEDSQIHHLIRQICRFTISSVRKKLNQKRYRRIRISTTILDRMDRN